MKECKLLSQHKENNTYATNLLGRKCYIYICYERDRIGLV